MRSIHQRLLPVLPRCGPLAALLLFLYLLALTGCGERSPKTLRLAVDASFVPALESLRADFERSCRCTLHITGAASGLLYSQIRAGNEFDLFLSADTERPTQLYRDGLAVPASLQTYARGQLAVWVSRRLMADAANPEAPDLAMLASLPAAELTPRQLILVLGRGKHKVIVADPQLAPDGDAAVKMLKGLRLWPRMRERMIYANHGGHAQIMLLQGAGDMGLVPYSQALLSGKGGEFMRVPARFYPALNQQLVILRGTRERTLAIQFVQFLLSDETQQRLPAVGFLPAERAKVR